MGTLTILLQDGIGVLYVNIPKDADIGKKGEWVEIPPSPGALVINGDMLLVQFYLNFHKHFISMLIMGLLAL
ncbi:putative leucoanthocyanidin dioxygenase [Corchorus olitorius]|uniref:Leucoanthocyanidin dioxygenase n=1 Tax=Corchorus olitorius TaxID=93759 RepID=A0A1R3KTF6_9ROSI|nr:putative leucoanthocyanidin dioxygenase [Corchorus olitorius]